MNRRSVSRESALILLLGFAAFASVTNSLQFTPLLTALAGEFGRSESAVGQIASLSSFVGTAVALLAAPWMHRRSMRFWLRLQTAVLLLSVAMMATASSFEMLALARVIAGLGGGALLATCFTAASEIVSDPARLGRGVAIVASGTTMSTLLGLPLLAVIREVAGWRWASASIAILLALVIIGTIWMPSSRSHTSSEERAEPSGSTKAVLRNSAAVWLLLTLVLLFVAYFGWIVYFAAYVEQEFSGGAALISTLFLVAGVAELAGNTTGPSLQRRFGGFAMTIAGATGMNLALLGSGVVFNTVALVFVAVSVLNVCVSFVYIGTYTVLLQVAAGHRAAVMALASAATGIGAAIGSLLGGRLLGALDDYEAMFRVLGAGMLVAAGCVAASWRSARRPE